MKTYPLDFGVLHFVGIGGIGMSALARFAIRKELAVFGYDKTKTTLTQTLEKEGACISFVDNISTLPQQIKNQETTLVVFTPAISLGNEILRWFIENDYRVMKRSEFLGEITQDTLCLAVAGTHGKTTTTSLVASILTEAGLDPTFINGGIINSFASNAKLGKGDYLVAEADESDKSFLMLQPSLAIITNIEADHLINYDNSFDKLRQAFLDFVKRLPFNGLLISCGDDPEIRNLLPEFSRSNVTYGFDESNDYVLSNYKSNNFRSTFSLSHENQLISIDLNMLGRHNALNASAACVLALEEGVDVLKIQHALKNFMGINRRMQVLGDIKIKNSISTLIDDYGHHPSEIRSTIDSIRESHPEKKLTMVFQPHRYSRTKDLFEEFIEVLQTVDQLILLDIYSAGEELIKNYESKDLLRRLRKTALKVCLSEESTLDSSIVEALGNDEGILLMQGAGNISKFSESIVKSFGN